jgi:hypothetical protein
MLEGIMKKLGSKLRAFAKARSMLAVITTVQVAGFVTAAVLIKDNDSRQARTTSTGTASRANDAGTIGATGSAFVSGREQFKPQAAVVEPIGPGSLLNTADADVDGVPITPSDDVVGMDRSGISPLAFGALHVPSPAGATAGTQNAFMSVSPDVVNPSTNAAIGTLLTGFTPGEPVQYFIGGSLAGTSAANSFGRLGARISTPAGEGYLTFEGMGLTSGKRAGGVAEVLTSATPVPGVAIGPHAINTSGGTIHMLGSRYPASAPITIARNGVSLETITSDSNGGFFVPVPVPAGADTSAIYTANSTAAGSLNGQSIEERADAGIPPQGDQNVSRAYFDRAVFPSTGAILGWVGEGFQPGETINISGCFTGSATADGNGAVSRFVSFGAGTGVGQCVYTGGASGRVARSTAQGDSNAVNVPAAINAPATLPTGGVNFVFLYDRLTASQAGTIYIDGVSQGPGSTNASGYGLAALIAPGAAGIHSVAFAGSSGQVAIAPLYIIAAGPTPTPTGPPTATPTRPPTARRLPRVIPFR